MKDGAQRRCGIMKIEDEILANPVLREVQNLLEFQTAKGLAKYGTTVNPLDYKKKSNG